MLFHMGNARHFAMPEFRRDVRPPPHPRFGAAEQPFDPISDLFRWEAFVGLAEEAAEQVAPQRPAASVSALRTLPRITVTERDLDQNEDAACPICLDGIAVGEAATRMPCGHLFHTGCIKEWLRTSNQCAICRFELQTDNLDYERERSSTGSKLRLRKSDLARRNVRELRFLADQLRINIRNCLEKSELVDRIIDSGLVVVAPEDVSAETSCNASRLRTLDAEISGSETEVRGHTFQPEDTIPCRFHEVTGIAPCQQILAKLLGKADSTRLCRTAPALADIHSTPRAEDVSSE